MKQKYYIELTIGDECDRYDGRWACWDLLVAEGNTLDELLDSAAISITDQDGGELDVCPADEGWMQDLIVEEYWRLNGKVRDVARLETFSDFVARMDRQGAAS